MTGSDDKSVVRTGVTNPVTNTVDNPATGSFFYIDSYKSGRSTASTKSGEDVITDVATAEKYVVFFHSYPNDCEHDNKWHSILLNGYPP